VAKYALKKNLEQTPRVTENSKATSKKRLKKLWQGIVMSDELDEFKVEIVELLERAEKALLAFDQLPDDESAPGLYDEVFRAYHNIKGAAGMMDWGELQHHVHQLESVLMQTKATQSIPKRYIGWFLRGNDATRFIMDAQPYSFSYELPGLENTESTSEELPQESSVASPQSSYSTSEEINPEFKSEVDDSLERISIALMKLENGVYDEGVVDALYRDIHSIKGAVQLFGFVSASTLAHAMESSLEGLRSGQVREIDKSHVSTLLLCIDLFPSCIQSKDNEEALKEVNFMVSLLDPFIKQKIAESPREAAKEVNVSKKEQVLEVAKSSPVSTGAVSANVETQDKSDTSIRVQVSLLDRLMALMGEMVLVRNQVLQYTSKSDDLEFLNLSQKLDVVTSELQEETMKTRMQPIGNILSKFQRVVRDLSGSLNKKINLNLIGVETELDKSLIEAVKDPLMHIVRNSCDHGIETPELRTAAGKNETGTVTIKAYHEGGQVIVDVSDDGRGLSREKLLKKAIERGIVKAEDTASMRDRDVQALIFAPGFSTAEQVTNVSGRGVGMDVVKSNIEKIGGLVDITSNEGQGTKITLKIPLTLAIVPAMIVRSGEDRYAIPQVKLVELVRVEKTAIEMVQDRPVYRLRGNILPLLNLKEVLEGQVATECEAINIVVLNSDNYLFGMVVDEILDTADIVVKPLARFLKPIAVYSGATVLGDGGVAFILDVQGIALKHFGSVGLSKEREMELQDKYAQGVIGEIGPREYVLVAMGEGAKHAIPLSMVSRMEEIKTSAIEKSGDERVIRYRGGVLRLISLNESLGHANELNKDITQVIVVKIEEQLFGLEVDQIIDVLSTRDYLDQSVTSHEAIIGNLVTANEIVVVVDVERIFENALKKAGQEISRNTGRKVLVVEDTESIRMKIVQDLKAEGYQVEIAVDGIEGLRQIANHRCNFDVIVSDIEMPRMNGYEFAKKVRAIERMRNTAIIAFTTKNSQADLKEAKLAGFSTFLEKGKGKLLTLLVNECLNSQKRKIA
jgi:two-component system chemotaxis sensor kinase CheA